MNKRDFLRMLGAGTLGASAIKFLPESNSKHQNVTRKDSADRILESGVIRVAYIVYPPYFTKDINTGAFGGMYYEMVNHVAAQLNLKVEWIEEVSFGNPFEGFFTGRYDLVGANIWPNGARLRRADFTKPICYSGFNAYVSPRQAHKFKKADDLDVPDVRIVTIEGEMSDPIARERYPKAHLLTLPNSASIAELILQIQSNKADAAILEGAFAAKYLQQNPGAVVPVTPEQLQVFPNGLCVGMHQHSFKSMLNALIEDMLNSGFVARLLEKYQSTVSDFIRVAQPYQT